uniref:Uncharacterized protein n=1 Tax=Arundo donax TaxID=35708 RepID=A0A0A9CSI4_ARUDO
MGSPRQLRRDCSCTITGLKEFFRKITKRTFLCKIW